MPATLTRRLPGISFEAAPPPRTDVLPRMDIAVFVGFAAAGPLHMPVKVEDENEFENIFGTDTPLAWDSEIGEPIFAYLAPAVRGFFRNGGQRCWVVRVAERQMPNAFAVPGLVRLEFTPSPEGGPPILGMSPAFARARSQGRWSDRILVSTVLQSEPLQLFRVSPDFREVLLVINSPGEIVPGDVVRLQDSGEGLFVFLPIETVEPVPPDDVNAASGSIRDRRLLTSIRAGQPVFLAASGVKTPTTDQVQLLAFDAGSPPSSKGRSINGRIATDPASGRLQWPTSASDPAVTLYLDIPFAQAPAIGSSLQVTTGQDNLWLTIEQSSVQERVDSPLGSSVSITGPAWWISGQPISPTDSPAQDAGFAAERLYFGFKVTGGDDATTSKGAGQNTFLLDRLAFGVAHPRCWNGLPSDEQLFAALSKGPSTSPPDLWQEIVTPRFPLAGMPKDTALFLPINMPYTPSQSLGCLPASQSPLVRDGLETFKLELFVDPRLGNLELQDLAAEVDFLVSQQPECPLLGIHAALGVDEATLLAVPDAGHRGWTPLQPQVPEIQPSSPLAHPEWWHFLPCDPPPVFPATPAPPTGHFLACDVEASPAPELWIETNQKQIVNESGAFTLSWSSSAGQAAFELEQATSPDFSDSARIHSGADREFQITDRPAGDYFYRVRLIQGSRTSDWSQPVAARVVLEEFWRANPRDAYSPAFLLGIHRTLLRTCAARGDMLAVLGLPDHYLTDNVLEHIQLLAPSVRSLPRNGAVPPTELLAPRLTFGEELTLGYGALYHPWGLAQNSDNIIARTPPEGIACGILARRALERGAWIAPANETWRGLVALTPNILAPDRTVLQQAQVNLVRQEPRGFLTLSADTLSSDPDLRPIHVRRLLTLLRRLALLWGPAYVFEPNDPSFRRLVQRNFQELLEDLFQRGAFAGDTAADSFQVVTDEALNTAATVEAGQFIVELRVAPAQALAFITIRLVQAGNGSLTLVEQ